MADEIGLFEAIYSQRAVRHLKPDPVPDELIEKIIDAGIHAPNGGNQQRWAFVVIKDPELKRKLAEPYKAEGHPDHGDAATWSQRNAEASADYLANHAAEVPVWILACTEHAGTDIHHGASIYPAVQNMLLAARALGLGATLTTRHLLYENETEAALGLPQGVHSYAILPIGTPMGNFGPVRRGALADFVYQDRWGETYQQFSF